MKFIISSTSMLGSLTAVSKAISAKPVLPILENILLESREGKLYATASDRETTIETILNIESIEGEGKIAMSTKLTDILKEFPELPLTLETNAEGTSMKITSQKGKFDVPGASAEDYPVPNTCGDAETVIKTTCSIMLDGINKSEFATGNDELRPQMNCILIEMNNDCFTFVASDAHKLVRFKRFDAQSDAPATLMLPKKPAQLLKNILPKDDTELTISYNNKQAIFTFGNYKIACTLIEGRFPNYNAVIPQNNPRKMIANTKDLYNTIKRVSVVANAASKLIKLQLADNTIEVSAQDSEYKMSGVESMSCQYEGDPIAIGFKAPYVLELLNNIGTENTLLELSDPTRPGLFLPYEAESQNGDLLMLLMPMMI